MSWWPLSSFAAIHIWSSCHPCLSPQTEHFSQSPVSTRPVQCYCAIRKSSTKQGLFSECSICISHTLGFTLPGHINRWLEKGHLIIYWLPLVSRNPWCKGSNSSSLAHLSQLMLPAGAALGYLHLSTNVLGLHCWKASWSKMTTQHACPTLPCSHFY